MTDEAAADRIARLERRLAREREARAQAERMLEQKSRELYEANEGLREAAQQLEQQVRERTRELADARDRAEAAARAKSNFLAVMSHEIRTPLHGVLAMTELLTSSPLNTTQQEYVEAIRASGDTLLVVLNDVLDFSKIDADRLELEIRDFDLARVLQAIGALHRPVAAARHIGMTIDTSDAGIRYLRGDSVRIGQIVSNLLSNAIKFTHVGNVAVRCRTRRDADRVLLALEVADTGIGIPDDRVDALFDAFTQGDASTTRRYGGTGLGLAISARLARAMGGDIRVRTARGVGTSFHVELRLEAGSEPEPVRSSPLFTGRTIAPMRVLVVDDNLVNQKLAQALLQRLGLGPDLAETGVEAVAKVRQGDYDVVFMDVQMPEMDGLEATRIIRALPLAKQPRIVAVTASAFASDRENCLEAGMDDFISKPFRLDDLYRFIADLSGPGDAPE
ncbi:MAG: ATP-binding protein [Betaproteobacteria bacterium]